MPNSFVDKFLIPLVVIVLGVGIPAIITAILVRYIPAFRVHNWAWRTWILHFRCGFFFRQRKSRRNARIICLEEYVGELTSTLNKLTSFARAVGTNECVIVVKVFTMQLPSDWPLWFINATQRETLETTPLGRYILKFKDFVAGTGDYVGIRSNVTRCIVIDNYGSPTKAGEGRLSQLRKDVREDWYQSYSELLHGADDEQAFHLMYDKPWPGWLTDSVFFGIKMVDNHSSDNPTKWLYGFTTSYNPGEDVLIYRYHYLPRPGATPIDFPGGVRSIAEMPTNRALEERMEPLSALTQQKAGDSGEEES